LVTKKSENIPFACGNTKKNQKTITDFFPRSLSVLSLSPPPLPYRRNNRRDFYFTGTESTKTPMPHPEQPAKQYNLFMRRMLSQSDFTEMGVVDSAKFGAWWGAAG
jgi:hypothetical protein